MVTVRPAGASDIHLGSRLTTTHWTGLGSVFRFKLDARRLRDFASTLRLCLVRQFLELIASFLI